MGCIIPPTLAQEIFTLPAPGTMIVQTPVFAPAVIKGVKIYPEDPFRFDFILDIEDTGLEGQALEDESQKLIKYFLASWTVPEKDMWVNLSPP